MPKKPPKLRERSWTNKRGERKTCYYYEHPRDDSGKRQLQSLGTDYKVALRAWAEIEGAKVEIDPDTLNGLVDEYFKWAEKLKLSGLAPRTLKDRFSYWRQLGPVFGAMVPTDITPEHLIQYHDARSSQASAKKEIRFLSVVYGWGFSRGKIPQYNPAAGITRYLPGDTRRDVYVTDEAYSSLWHAGDQLLRDFMDITYLCGNRPDETAGMLWSDVGKTEITVRLIKTEKKGHRIKRIPIGNDLKQIITRLRAAPIVGRHVLVDEHGQQLKLQGQLRYRHNQARKASGETFQLRDIRPKAATDTAAAHGIEAARKLLGHTTQKQTAEYIRPLMGEIAEQNPDLAKVISQNGESS